MKAAELFVRQLEEEGVTCLFGLPGEENLHLLEAVRKANLKVVITRHEQAAAFMAATYGRLTGRAGVCFSTLGPGATNLVTGVVHAQLIGAPLVSISAQKPRKENWQAKFQLVDVMNLMKPITKKTFSIFDPNTIPTVLRDAFKTAEAERPGAVHIELPEDVAEEETNARVQKRGEVRRPAPDPKAIDSAVELIERAKNPLVIVSSGANRKRITRHLLAFLRKTGIYVVHTQMGKGVISDDCEYSLFATGIHKHDYVNCGIDQADLIITVGYNIAEYPPFMWNRNLDKTILNIDFVESEPDPYFNPAVEVVGDISHSLREIAEKIQGQRSFPVFARTRSLLEKKIHEKVESRYPLLPQEVVRGVREVMAPEDIVALDNGIYKLWFSRLYPTFKAEHLSPGQCLGHDGSRPSLRDRGQNALSRPEGARRGRGWRVHDEFSGTGDGHPLPGADRRLAAERQRLRLREMEATEFELRKLRDGSFEPGFCEIRGELWRKGNASGAGTEPDPRSWPRRSS